MSMTDPHGETPCGRVPGLWTVAWRMILATLLCLMAIAFASGVFDGASSDGSEIGVPAMIAIAIGIAVLAFVLKLLLWPLRHLRIEGGPRTRRSKIFLYLSVLLGLIMGLAVAIAGDAGDSVDILEMVYAPGRLSPGIAVMLILSTIAAVALTVMWMGSIDEHERASYDFGSNVAIHYFFALSACWWFAQRGGIAPPINGLVVFWSVCAVWVAGWAWRRFR
jgi:uncharacterized membrane protein (GlpM family)